MFNNIYIYLFTNLLANNQISKNIVLYFILSKIKIKIKF